MVLFRHQKLRLFSETAIKEMNELPAGLAAINIFPVEGRELPVSAPDMELHKIIYHLCRSDHDSVIRLVNGGRRVQHCTAFAILCALKKGQHDAALACLDQIIELADPESDPANWAQMKRLNIK
jgi:hypothetical protein